MRRGNKKQIYSQNFNSVNQRVALALAYIGEHKEDFEKWLKEKQLNKEK